MSAEKPSTGRATKLALSTLAITLALGVAPSLAGVGTSYNGEIEKDPYTSFEMLVDTSGKPKVTYINATFRYACTDGTTGRTSSDFIGNARVKGSKNKFKGTFQRPDTMRGEDPPPQARVTGRLKKNDSAKGTIDITFIKGQVEVDRATLVGPDCYTGRVDWKASSR